MTDELQPGRELDALIAERVFGFRREKAPPDCNGEHGGTEVLVPPHIDTRIWQYPPKGPIALTHFVLARYSTRIEDAWKVVEVMRARTFSRRKRFLEELTRLVRERTGQQVAWPDVFWFVTPEIICVAALQAVAAPPKAVPPQAA